MSLRVVPLTLADANAFVELHHRHHKPSRGHKFSIGAVSNGTLVGCAIVGRPVSRGSDDGRTLEVTRLCTDGTKNACSLLYSAAARAARELGYSSIQTYTLESEHGTSLLASGWTREALTAGGKWVRSEGTARREDQPHDRKWRWSKRLSDPVDFTAPAVQQETPLTLFA